MLKLLYYAKSTFERFPINNLHPRHFYNPSWYEKSLSSPPLALSFFIKYAFQTGGLQFGLSVIPSTVVKTVNKAFFYILIYVAAYKHVI